MQPFQPRYIQPTELEKYGLPTQSRQNDIMSLVDGASTLIDESCGRLDVDATGSLIFTTYTERLIMPEGRNIVRTSYRPLSAVPATVANELTASGAGEENNYFTGFTANTITRPDGVLSPVVSAQGRYGYRRRGEAPIYPDSNYGINPLMLASFFGGPPTFTAIDVSMIDFDPRSGELWIPAGLYISQYSEVEVKYNSGFDPRTPPNAIKFATAAVIKNALLRGGGTTGMTGYSGAGKMSVNFTDDLIDPTVEKWLRNYMTVIAR